MRSTINLVIVALLLLHLSACRLAVKQYEEPSSSFATIEFKSEADAKMSVYLYEGYEACTDRLGVGAVEPKSGKLVRVPAGSQFVFSSSIDSAVAGLLFGGGVALGGVFGGLAVGSAMEQGCRATLQFFPEEGRSYVFRMFSDGKGCGYQLFEKPPDNQANATRPVDYVKRTWRRPFDESGPFCEALR